MKKQISYGVEIKADLAGFDLVSLVGQWQAQVDIQVSNLSQITHGPIKIVLQEPLHAESPITISGPKQSYNPVT